MSRDTASQVPDPAEWITAAARAHPQRAFLTTPAGREVSYALLEELTARIGRALERRGVASGERVAVRVEKSIDAVLIYLACLRIGAVFVPINTLSSGNEVEHFLTDSSPRVLVLRPQERAALAPLAAAAGVAVIETLDVDGAGSLPELARSCEAGALEPRVHERNAPAAILYTSGTTGRPKGAVLTRANLASNAAALASAWRFSGADVLLHVLPLFHVHGLFVAINTVLVSASSILLVPSFDAAATVAQLAKVTVFMGVPTHYTRLLKQPELDADSTAHVRLFVSGSAPLLPETQREFLERTGHVILERYGMTETLMNTSNPYEGPRVPGSVGLPLEGVAIRVAHPETGLLERSPDGVGVLEIKGPNVFAGYWRDPDKTASAFSADGFFRSGDLGRIDRNGYVHIVGRAKDLVISGGYNVYPQEIEAELNAVPGVAESAVIGLPHPDLGEAVTAILVLKADAVLTEDEVIAAIRERVARYKLPKRALFASELPRNAMGKVQKAALRALHAELYRDA